MGKGAADQLASEWATRPLLHAIGGGAGPPAGRSSAHPPPEAAQPAASLNCPGLPAPCSGRRASARRQPRPLRAVPHQVSAAAAARGVRRPCAAAGPGTFASLGPQALSSLQHSVLCRYRDIWEFYKRAEASFWTGAFERAGAGEREAWPAAVCGTPPLLPICCGAVGRAVLAHVLRLHGQL